MAGKNKIAIISAFMLLLAPNFAFARSASNNAGNGMVHALGKIARGTGKVFSGTGHVVVHGTGRIFYDSANALADAKAN